MMRTELERKITEIFGEFPSSSMVEAGLLPPNVQLYDTPLIGVAAADDKLFSDFKAPGVVGPWYKTPSEWLSDAKTVISLFFPSSEYIRLENRKCDRGPSMAWLYGRYEGQQYINAFMEQLRQWLDAQGYACCVPSSDARFRTVSAEMLKEYPRSPAQAFGSNWSERHAAYVCGLGTFGLSCGLITEKGMAGRFGSIITSAEIEPDERSYTEIYEYCIKCGLCISRCPAGAISENGKNHSICANWLDTFRAEYSPRYGCGLCQTAVPCEYRIPYAPKRNNA